MVFAMFNIPASQEIYSLLIELSIVQVYHLDKNRTVPTSHMLDGAAIL
jgi:hypothetical protein